MVKIDHAHLLLINGTFEIIPLEIWNLVKIYLSISLHLNIFLLIVFSFMNYNVDMKNYGQTA